MTVNKERLKLGIEALRSGKYVQGKRALAPIADGSPDSDEPEQQQYCCLGVLCEVALANGLTGIERVQGVFQVGYLPTDSDVDKDADFALLPDAVRDWYGLATSGPLVIDEDGDMVEVAHLNDDGGYTFDRISDAFERTFIGGE